MTLALDFAAEQVTRYTVTQRSNPTAMASRSAEEYRNGWVDVSTDGAPSISDRAARVLRRRVFDRLDEASDPTAWRSGDWGAWMATADLHHAGHHDDALELAKLLRWTTARATAKDSVIWTLATA